MLKGILSIIAGSALNVASFSANSVCPIFLYDMKMPESVKKLGNK